MRVIIEFLYSQGTIQSTYYLLSILYLCIQLIDYHKK